MASTQLTTLGAVGGGDLAAAAEVIAQTARELAATWSKQIPPRITVAVAGNTAVISCDVGPAYPGETRARHPLFGNRKRWYGPPGAPFLGPAADARAGAAMARYAKKIDRMCRKAGFHVKITFEGREWEFKLEEITLKQAVAMHLAYGFTLDSWFKACARDGPARPAVPVVADAAAGRPGDRRSRTPTAGSSQLAAAFGDARSREGGRRRRLSRTLPPRLPRRKVLRHRSPLPRRIRPGRPAPGTKEAAPPRLHPRSEGAAGGVPVHPRATCATCARPALTDLTLHDFANYIDSADAYLKALEKREVTPWRRRWCASVHAEDHRRRRGHRGQARRDLARRPTSWPPSIPT